MIVVDLNFIVDNTERNTGDDSKAGGLLATTGGKIQYYRSGWRRNLV